MSLVQSTQWSFLVGCVLFSVDGFVYICECVESPTSTCMIHSGLYTSGSLLFLVGTVLWLVEDK